MCVLNRSKKRWKRYIYQYPAIVTPKEGGVTSCLYWTEISILAGSFIFSYVQEKSISALKCIDVTDFVMLEL